MTDFDAIIIGAGHNGLVCGSYLAKAGKKVLVLESRAVPGGCAAGADLPELYPAGVAVQPSYVAAAWCCPAGRMSGGGFVGANPPLLLE